MVKFIVLCTARTGSNYLLNLLAGHDRVKVVGEIFNLDKLPKADMLKSLEDPIDYFNKKLSLAADAKATAIGAKIFYEHLTMDYFSKVVPLEEAASNVRNRIEDFKHYVEANVSETELDDKFRRTWEHIIQDKSLYIIHLKRQNMLQSLISLKKAYQTDEWLTIKRATDGNDPSVNLTEQECSDFFETIKAYEEKYDKLFAGHRKIDITYEDLVTEKDEIMNKVTDFLGIARFAASSVMKKQSHKPASETVLNYPLLKRKFENSEWGRFFE